MATRALPLLLAVLALVLAAAPCARGETWAVIVSTSRFWFNYRHTANALLVHRAARRLGVPEENIVLMLADTHACSTRNGYPGHMGNVRIVRKVALAAGNQKLDEETNIKFGLVEDRFKDMCRVIRTEEG